MPGWSRRQLLQAGLSGALAPRAAHAAVSPSESLDALARKKGLRFGTALGGRTLANAEYLALVQAQCGILVPENEMKMTWLQRNPGELRFEPADRIVAFGESHGMLVRGHTLLWHHPRWLPKWLETYDFGTEPATAASALLADHIRKTCQHFGRRLCSWDVVNEAVDNITGQMRETEFSRRIGSPDKVIDLAFHIAREELPDTELVYNDYMGWENDNAPHRDGVLRLLERLRRDGVPVNALGIQAHIGAGNQDSNANRAFDARDEKAWRKFLKEVTGMGYHLVITEFDVHDAPLASDIRKRDREVAALGRAFLDITLDFREVGAVLCWGLADNFSWLQGRTRRADGQPKRPTPFDSQYHPKPLRDAIAAAFRAAPARRPVRSLGEPA